MKVGQHEQNSRLLRRKRVRGNGVTVWIKIWGIENDSLQDPA